MKTNNNNKLYVPFSLAMLPSVGSLHIRYHPCPRLAGEKVKNFNLDNTSPSSFYLHPRFAGKGVQRAFSSHSPAYSDVLRINSSFDNIN